MTTSALSVPRREYKCKKAHSPTKIILFIPHPTFLDLSPLIFFSARVSLGCFGHPISSVSLDCVPKVFFGSGSDQGKYMKDPAHIAS